MRAALPALSGGSPCRNPAPAPSCPISPRSAPRMVAAAPPIASSIMGLFPPEVVARLKARGIAWFSNATTLAEARAAEAAGADAVVAQGAEAGGHRGSFEAGAAERSQVGLFALLPQVADAVSRPGRRGGRHHGRARHRRGADAGRQRGADGHRLPALPEAAIHPAWSAAIAAPGRRTRC